MKSTNPYKEIIDNGYITRIFSIETDSSELVWHRDKQDRRIIIVSGDDWYFQFDNELPFKLNKNDEILINKNNFHRIIKGTSDLIVNIYFL